MGPAASIQRRRRRGWRARSQSWLTADGEDEAEGPPRDPVLGDGVRRDPDASRGGGHGAQDTAALAGDPGQPEVHGPAHQGERAPAGALLARRAQRGPGDGPAPRASGRAPPAAGHGGRHLLLRLALARARVHGAQPDGHAGARPRGAKKSTRPYLLGGWSVSPRRAAGVPGEPRDHMRRIVYVTCHRRVSGALSAPLPLLAQEDP
eukprot:1572663-Pyramimonas_sp.AAC.2